MTSKVNSGKANPLWCVIYRYGTQHEVEEYARNFECNANKTMRVDGVEIIVLNKRCSGCEKDQRRHSVVFRGRVGVYGVTTEWQMHAHGL